MLSQLLAPVTLLTALPVPRVRHAITSVPIGLFPVVGLLLGGLLIATDALAGLLLPNVAASAIVVISLVALTGALHIDGLADSADGVFGGRSREQRLAIMRDPRTGAFGFVAITSVLLLKWAALMELEGSLRTGALLLVPMLSRWSLLPTMLLWPSMPGGMADGLPKAGRLPQVVFGSAIAITLCLIVFWPAGVTLAAIAVGVALLVGAYAIARLGGTTGDVFGAIVELTEATLLIVIATSASRAWLT